MSYTLNKKTYKLLVADTSEKREKGLMFYRKLEDVDGMIFIFPDKQIRSFWNKNTFMDLDIYWLATSVSKSGTNRLLGSVFLPSIEKTKKERIVESTLPVDRVIEIPHKN
jgi:hypothetical protein